MRAVFRKLDAKLAAAGFAVSPPAPAPPPLPPPPALSFEAWAELSVRFASASPEDVAAALAGRGLTPEAYHVPTEAALRALEEQWRHPAQRAELENAMAEFAVALRCRVLR